MVFLVVNYCDYYQYDSIVKINLDNIKSVVTLRKVKKSDRKYFAIWWNDKALRKVTSGRPEKIGDKEIDRYFLSLLQNKKDRHYIISVDNRVIGHQALRQNKNGWSAIDIIIGKKSDQGKGYGSKAIKQLIKKANKLEIKKIYLTVRPNNFKAINTYKKCGFYKVGIKRYPQNPYMSKLIRMNLKEK